jgi:hypothetical protein
VELEKWEQTLHGCPWRTTKGAAPCAVKVARTVLNGEREETYRKATRLALTQRTGPLAYLRNATVNHLKRAEPFGKSGP